MIFILFLIKNFPKIIELFFKIKTLFEKFSSFVIEKLHEKKNENNFLELFWQVKKYFNANVNLKLIYIECFLKGNLNF